ncbi:Pyridoxal phosphate-dependent transferase major region subdomain 2 [Penicillium cosmopolitanum]|uniref:Pyridoxal phosphate-dependent transferase major region subdomain 2 n=1 Tax=Penicillium cosmopolitanum TaxID=1131564 RepID=A0A9X0B4J8_9EURO|nr:Pyridoxal phosphate-dependent transferase major region subdomain 2 [Penicillium cosmopolitanum]KAJ5387847.1 Pyridoxal phosphate-dependent transferase major region subdomain 2 [Penicillium cosmopolitanum]
MDEKIIQDLWKAAQGPWETGVLPSTEQLSRARKSIPNTLPATGSRLDSVQRHILEEIVPAFNGGSISPNYYGFITGGVTPAALFADNVVSAYDQNVQVHLPNHSIVTDVEFNTLGMLADLFRLERSTWQNGTFTTGATASNILGLACGREFVLQKAAQRNGSQVTSVGENGLLEVLQAAGLSGIQVLSTMPHSSLVKAAGVLGIGRANVRNVCSADNVLHFDMDVLEKELARKDKATIVAISCGEVNTGRFATSGAEQMKEIRRLCDKYDAWIHVDGAFGIFCRGLEDTAEFATIKKGAEGIELADSITGDGHKLLNVPYDCGLFFCRHHNLAPQVFQNANAAYLSSGPSEGPSIPSPLNIGLENSRRFRALPVYASLLSYGREGYSDMLQRQIGLARAVYGWIYDSPAYIALPEATSKPELLDQTFMSVLFRAKNDNLNSELAKRINETSRMFVSGTSWQGAPACRIAISNWRVNVERDTALVTEVLNQVAQL